MVIVAMHIAAQTWGRPGQAKKKSVKDDELFTVYEAVDNKLYWTSAATDMTKGIITKGIWSKKTQNAAFAIAEIDHSE